MQLSGGRKENWMYWTVRNDHMTHCSHCAVASSRLRSTVSIFTLGSQPFSMYFVTFLFHFAFFILIYFLYSSHILKYHIAFTTIIIYLFFFKLNVSNISRRLSNSTIPSFISVSFEHRHELSKFTALSCNTRSITFWNILHYSTEVASFSISDFSCNKWINPLSWISEF